MQLEGAEWLDIVKSVVDSGTKITVSALDLQAQRALAEGRAADYQSLQTQMTVQQAADKQSAENKSKAMRWGALILAALATVAVLKE